MQGVLAPHLEKVPRETEEEPKTAPEEVLREQSQLVLRKSLRSTLWITELASSLMLQEVTGDPEKQGRVLLLHTWPWSPFINQHLHRLLGLI